MSKLADQLRALKIYNTNGLLTAFGKSRDVVVSFSGQGTFTSEARGSKVWSPRFKTNPGGAWYDYGAKKFVGKRAETMPKAKAWAAEHFGITEWASCPFDSAAYVPKHVLAAAKAAVATQTAGTNDPHIQARAAPPTQEKAP